MSEPALYRHFTLHAPNVTLMFDLLLRNIT
jgi:hypothetical protein